MMNNFNTKYREFKRKIVELINTSDIPAAIVRDYLAGDVIPQLDRVVTQELEREQEQNAQEEETEES